jgi:hypothetical protein
VVFQVEAIDGPFLGAVERVEHDRLLARWV